jgi:hypothetical protein
MSGETLPSLLLISFSHLLPETNRLLSNRLTVSRHVFSQPLHRVMSVFISSDDSSSFDNSVDFFPP